jgi:hypothetical protein
MRMTPRLTRPAPRTLVRLPANRIGLGPSIVLVAVFTQILGLISDAKWSATDTGTVLNLNESLIGVGVVISPEMSLNYSGNFVSEPLPF